MSVFHYTGLTLNFRLKTFADDNFSVSEPLTKSRALISIFSFCTGVFYHYKGKTCSDELKFWIVGFNYLSRCEEYISFHLSHSVFYPLGKLSAIFIKSLSVWKSLKFVVWVSVFLSPNDKF